MRSGRTPSRNQRASCANLLLQKSQNRFEDIQREIDGLKMKRREVETSLEGIIATITNTVAYVREQDIKHHEEKILLHRPRQSETPGAHSTQQSEARAKM